MIRWNTNMAISIASKARELIQSTELTNLEIAEQLGTSEHYVRMIRKKTGRTDLPTARAAGKAARQQKFLDSLVACHGIVSDAARKAGVSAEVPYSWMAEDPDFKAKVAEAKEIAIDFVESSLFRQIQKEVPASTIFFLKTRAKHRGYIERSEITGAEGGPLDIRVIVPRTLNQRIEPREDDIEVNLPETPDES